LKKVLHVQRHAGRGALPCNPLELQGFLLLGQNLSVPIAQPLFKFPQHATVLQINPNTASAGNYRLI